MRVKIPCLQAKETKQEKQQCMLNAMENPGLEAKEEK